MSVNDPHKPMDEVMLAMDVVDTLRRNSRVVERELNVEMREAELLERLKELYGTQGIEVSDDILREGVIALREDRFVYKPTPPSFSRSLARFYVKRKKWGKPVLLFGIFFLIILILSFFSDPMPAGYVTGAR